MPPESADRGSRGRVLVGLGAIVFGVMTLVAGARALVVGEAGMGPIVRPVLAFNLAAALLYVAAGVGIARDRGWARPLAQAIAAATVAAFLALAVYLALGGVAADRTVVAMIFRAAVWSSIAIGLPRAATAGSSAPPSTPTRS